MLKVYISHGGFDAMMAGPQILIVEILPDGTRRYAKPITLVMEPLTRGMRVEPTGSASIRPYQSISRSPRVENGSR